MINLKPINKLKGNITVPGDKSISHRAVMIGSIAEGVTHISGFLNGEDCLSTISCFKKMGVKIEICGTDVTLYGNGINGLKAPQSLLDTGNSGTTTRILTGLLAGQSFTSTINGDASIQKRPMNRVIEPLKQLGANIQTQKGYCPMTIYGRPLMGADITIPVASAQVKSAIILAGLYANGITRVTEPELSRNHTEIMLKAFGANIETVGTTVTVKHCHKLIAKDVTVPADISSAAFFMVAASIILGSEITLKKVGINQTRTGIIDVLRQMGANITLHNENYDVEPYADITVKYAPLTGTTIGGSIIPRLIDELPIIAVAALFAKGQTVIKDAAELKVKETNRINAVVTELKKCGAHIAETDDGMIIDGGYPLHSAHFDSYGDHRIAMSMAVLAGALKDRCTLSGEEAVSISYPTFFEDLERLAV